MNNIVEMLRDEADIIAGEGATEYSVNLLIAAANRIEELEASQSNVVTEGWKLVPVEPTYEMRRKAGLTIGGDYYTISKIWKSMISASPKPPHGDE